MKAWAFRLITRINEQRKTITAVDLFCGAGGTSTGLREACKVLGFDLKLVAVNHWQIAIATHSSNHPESEHFCTDLAITDPRKLITGGKLDLLIASPECTHHSIARGGKPVNDQSRASAWRIVEWCSQISIKSLLIENVKEFQSWGPIGANGQPLKRRRGETYQAFLSALRSLDYTVEARVLNAANHGDPTSRERLFVIAHKGRKVINWPAPTHTRDGRETLFHKPQKWRSAREIVDWELPGESIFTRKRPLSPNTMARIFAGLRKYCGLPFIVPKESGERRVRSIDQPLQIITTESRGIGLCEPFIIPNFGERPGQQPRTHSIDQPLPAVTSHGAGALIQPYLVKFYGGYDAASVDEPLPTVCANYEHYGLAQPFIVELRNNQDARSIEDPLSTIMTSGAHHALCQLYIVPVNHGRGDLRSHSVEKPMPALTTVDAWGLIEPFLTRFQGSHDGRNDGQQRNYPLDAPLPTLDTSNRFGLVQPYLIQTAHGQDAWPERRCHSVEEPMKTITANGDEWALLQPFLVKYNGTGSAMSVDEPLATVTTKDRFGLVILQLGAVLDIRFRMLQPHELAAAMSFPKSYFFAGNRKQKVRQIGNAVPVNTARALCTAILGGS